MDHTYVILKIPMRFLENQDLKVKIWARFTPILTLIYPILSQIYPHFAPDLSHFDPDLPHFDLDFPLFDLPIWTLGKFSFIKEIFEFFIYFQNPNFLQLSLLSDPSLWTIVSSWKLTISAFSNLFHILFDLIRPQFDL